MAMQKPIILILSLITLVITAGAVLFYQTQRFDPCQKWSRTELANIYKPLADLLADQEYETNQLLAQQHEQDFLMNIEMTEIPVSPEEALVASTQQIQAVAALRQRHSQEFEELCRRLVDK